MLGQVVLSTLWKRQEHSSKQRHLFGEGVGIQLIKRLSLCHVANAWLCISKRRLPPFLGAFDLEGPRAPRSKIRSVWVLHVEHFWKCLFFFRKNVQEKISFCPLHDLRDRQGAIEVHFDEFGRTLLGLLSDVQVRFCLQMSLVPKKKHEKTRIMITDIQHDYVVDLICGSAIIWSYGKFNFNLREQDCLTEKPLLNIDGLDLCRSQVLSAQTEWRLGALEKARGCFQWSSRDSELWTKRVVVFLKKCLRKWISFVLLSWRFPKFRDVLQLKISNKRLPLTCTKRNSCSSRRLPDFANPYVNVSWPWKNHGQPSCV